MQAYCTRYKDNPSFYSNAWNYTPSYGIDVYNAGLYPSWNAYFRQLMRDTRTACPTQMIRTWGDWPTPTSYGQDITADAERYDYMVGFNDTVPGKSSTGVQIFTGQIGGIDYRGPSEPWVPFWGEVEEPEMCGHVGQFTPAQIYDRWKNFLASKRGAYLFDGSTSTERTAAYVKANVCPYSRGCQ